MKLPLGFRATGINCGVRRYRPDLGLIFSERPCVAAGVFTTNSLKAAPVLYDQALLPSDKIQAIVVNSGQANAATGSQGVEDNLALATRTAESLGISTDRVLVSSTGVIGVRLALDFLLPGIHSATKSMTDTINLFALAIMTTDLVPKGIVEEVEIGGKMVTLSGAAKGSGMIHPNMATMLGFVLCDAEIDKQSWDQMVKECCAETFNMISVDGETSTNDSVIALANGGSGVKINSASDKEILQNVLRKVCTHLATSIARDGEGATKLLHFNVRGMPTLELAREAARLLSTSPLIKSAIHGEDPNWGRILARLGMAEIPSDYFEKLSVRLQETQVFESGKPLPFDRSIARQQLKSDEVYVIADFKSGKFEATAWGCDLTKRYVEINTEYS